MTPSISDLLRAASDRAVPVVRGIPEASLEAPTPTPEYRVRDLLNHLFHVVTGFRAFAVKQQADFSSTPDSLHGDWRSRFPLETGRLVAAWAGPGAEDGTTGALRMPARTVGGMALLDLTVHPWELARATGQDFTPDPGAADELAGLVRELGPAARERKAFGEPVEPPANASAFERLLAATGRDPRWSPPPAAG